MGQGQGRSQPPQLQIGMIALPRFAVGMIMARKLVAADNPHDAIFASRCGTWLSPNNVRRQWREAGADTDLAWVTPHTFRKTVATLIKEETDTKSAAAQLGHSSEEVTATYYIGCHIRIFGRRFTIVSQRIGDRVTHQPEYDMSLDLCLVPPDA